MRGSVSKYETAAGTRWRIVYDLPPDPETGGRRQTSKRGFATKAEAEDALLEIMGHVRDGTYIDPASTTVRDYLVDEWLPSRRPRAGGPGHRGSVAIGTWHSYRDDIRAHVLPRIGHIRLQQLTPRHLEQLYDELEESGGRREQGLSPTTVANIHALLHKALADAVTRGHLLRNPADALEAPRRAHPDTDWWTVEELRLFLTHVRDDDHYAMWLLFATTGMRRGEVAGLTWDDIDLDAGRLRVEWTLGAVDSKPTWKPRPKSKAGERTMSLDPATVDALRAHRANQSEQRLAAGPAWVDEQTDWRGNARSGLVFCWPDGRMINPERISKWFTRHAKAAGLRRIRLHDVRHTYASAALANATGWHDVKVISERLGHASVAITLELYAHVLPAADEEMAHTLANLILGT